MIYILEDDDNIRKLINYSLTSQGFKTSDFALPSEFWNKLKNEKPDLFLLDIMLPEEDGISIISGFAEILKAGGVDENTTKDFASSIYDESQRMITLVNDIIKLSKLDEKSISLEKETISLRDMCREVINSLSAIAPASSTSLLCRLWWPPSAWFHTLTQRLCNVK